MTLEMSAGLPWGLLLVTDSVATDEIPSWASPTDLVAHGPSALVVRTTIEDEGEVTFSVSGERIAGLEDVFMGQLQINSGLLRIGDALQTSCLDYAIEPGAHEVRVYVDLRQEPTRVHIVIDQM